jgi:hypothetical protein
MQFDGQMQMLQKNIPAPLLGQTVETESSSEHFFSLLHDACCFNYFFNIPNHASIIYTLRSTKFTLKHLKFAPKCPLNLKMDQNM